MDTTGQVHTKSSALTGRVTRVVTSDLVENEMNETKVKRKYAPNENLESYMK